MSGKIRGGTGNRERGALHSMGSVLTASDWRSFGGDQTVDFGAKKLDRVLPMAGKTRRLSELLLHPITGQGVGSREKTMDPGRAAEEAPGREEDLKQKHISIVQTTQGWGQKKAKRPRVEHRTAAELRTLKLVELVYGKKVS